MNEEALLKRMDRIKSKIDERIKDREIIDAFGRVVTKGAVPAPDNDAQRRIAALLRIPCRPRKYRFPKCSTRDYRRASKLDREDGFTWEQIWAGEGFHTVQGHLCSLCRCQHVAGWGSRGWWYWSPESGLPEVGHYGVGPCYLHGPYYQLKGGKGKPLDHYRGAIVKEIEAMQQYGQAPDSQGGYLIDMRAEAEIARQRQDTRTALHAIHALANETITALRRHRETRTAEEDFLRETCEVFGFPLDMLEPADRLKLLQIALMRPLTEYVQGKLRPMSDDTAISLERNLLKDISTAAKTAFSVHEDQYTSNDDVLLLLERFYSEAEMAFRAKAGEEEWTRFVGALKDVGKGFSDRSIEASAVVKRT